LTDHFGRIYHAFVLRLISFFGAVTGILLGSLLLTAAPALAQSRASEGILLMAHGGSAEWNARVSELAATMDRTQPTEVAFGMASRPTIQTAIDRLAARGVGSIVAVPLFVSSNSSVVTSTAYLLGLRADMPADLKVFAKMNHGAAATGTAGHEGHGTGGSPAVDNTLPVKSALPIRMTGALDRHPIVAAILADRARAISSAPEQEAVILAAHGPVRDDENQRWLDDMQVLANHLDNATSFAAIDWLTVRDDAPPPIRDAAAEELRALVRKHTAAGRRVLIVPLLLSYGGIEKGIRQRLDGLPYVMATQGLMPDPRLVEWVRQVVR
jgi:sirohydrochlorin ferrochelatase